MGIEHRRDTCPACSRPAWCVWNEGEPVAVCRRCEEAATAALIDRWLFQPKPDVSGQSRKGSAAEAIANTAIGYVVAVAAQAVILPAFGLHASTGQHLGIAAAFTAVSLVRGYVLRRVFNRYARP